MLRLPATTPIPLAPVAVMLPELVTEARAPEAKIALNPPFAEIVPALLLVAVIGAPATIVASNVLLAVIVPVLDVTVMPPRPPFNAPPVPPDIIPALLTAIVLPLTAVPLAVVVVETPPEACDLMPLVPLMVAVVVPDNAPAS